MIALWAINKVLRGIEIPSSPAIRLIADCTRGHLGRYQVLLSESDNPVVTIGSYQVMFHYRIVTTATSIVNLKTVFLDICKQQGDGIIRIMSVGKNSLFFPQREGRREGEGVKVTQVSKLSTGWLARIWTGDPLAHHFSQF